MVTQTATETRPTIGTQIVQWAAPSIETNLTVATRLAERRAALERASASGASGKLGLLEDCPVLPHEARASPWRDLPLHVARLGRGTSVSTTRSGLRSHASHRYLIQGVAFNVDVQTGKRCTLGSCYTG